jgi:hypothetical protein
VLATAFTANALALCIGLAPRPMDPQCIESRNANSSTRCKFDSDSNEIDESEQQYEKHDLHKCVTDDGITTESIDPKYQTIKQRELSGMNSAKTQNSLAPGEIENDLS